MSDGISFTNGQAEAIYTGRRADVWHRFGTYVGDRPLTREEVRGVVGIPVEVFPTSWERPLGNGDSVSVPSTRSFVTVRTDSWKELAAVGPDYTVIPYAEALVDNLLPIVDTGLATFDVAGLLRDGVKGWVMLKWNTEKMSSLVQEVYGTFGLLPYTLFFAAHGLGIANQAQNTTIRGVCENTTEMTLSKAADGYFRVVHRKNGRTRQLDATRDMFKGILAEFETTATAYRLLKQTRLDKALWLELVQKVGIPNPTEAKDWNKDAPRADLVVERFKEKANRVFKLWTAGTGHSGDLSAWEAYNGLVESLDHDTDMWKARSDENRAVSLMSGPLGKIRQDVFSSLLSYAQKHNGKVSTLA